MIDENKMVRMILGFKVKHLRQQLGLSYQELATKTGLSTSYINDIERGKKYPKPAKLTQLGKGLEVDYNFLVSTKKKKKLQPVIDLLHSDFFKNFPLEEFGISPDKLLEVFTSTPEKVSAFVSTIFKIARHYQVTEAEFYKVALRSYQDMHNNYFADLEAAVVKFRKQFGVRKALLEWKNQLEKILTEEYNISIDYDKLNQQKSLRGIRSYFNKNSRTLLINNELSSKQQYFLLARELAFQFLNYKNRPYETRILQIDNFEQLLNNFRASYFAVALLMPEKTLVKDIERVSRSSDWNGEVLLKWLDKYQVTQEMLMQRLTNILPQHFGIEDLFFLRLTSNDRLDHFRMTKELHLSQLHNPYNNQLEEHYCRRWVSVTALKELRTKMAMQPDQNRLADGQISQYWQTDNEYFCMSLAKPTSSDSKESVSVTVGLLITPNLRSTFNFLNDPKLRKRTVHTTCERCSVSNCESRVKPPVVIEEERSGERVLEELGKL
ncbi:MAG: helix-turn-helix domain-containing protein [Saprospiraceae bacterium]